MRINCNKGGSNIVEKFIKSIIRILIIFISISFISFGLMYLSPSDPAEMILTAQGTPVTAELIEQTRMEMGLDKPFINQYVTWLSNVFKGDLGVSISTGRQVSTELIEHLPYTLILAVTASIVTIIVSVPLGIIAAINRGKIIDKIIKLGTFAGNSVPSFFLALTLLLIFSLKLKWFPVLSESGIRSAILPSLTLVIPMSAKYIRQVRTLVLRELDKEYVKALEARGVKKSRILYINILKNVLITLITLIGLSFGSLLGGTAIVEAIFVWPGLGSLALSAISSRDYNLIQGYVLWMAIIFIAVNYITNFLYKIIDPRVRL